MTRDQMIEAASREAAMVLLFTEVENKGDIRTASDLIAERILNAIEPLIRADERDTHVTCARDRLEMAHLRADTSAEIAGLKARLRDSQRQAEGLTERRVNLRAKVEALWLAQIVAPDRDTYVDAIKDVLGLIDGSSDGDAWRDGHDAALADIPPEARKGREQR